MIHEIYNDGSFRWECVNEECREIHVSTLSTIKQTRGVIALPPCEICESATFLKVDYSLKELFKVIETVMDTTGTIRGYALPFRHVRNLRLHAMLYATGESSTAPVLPNPPDLLLEHPVVRQLPNPDLIYSLWFAYAVMWQRKAISHPFTEAFYDLTHISLVLPEGIAVPQIERETTHGTSIH